MKNNLTNVSDIFKYTSFLLSVIPFCISILSIFFMAESIPMHYNASGEVNRYGSSMEFVLVGVLFSAMAVVMSIAFERIKMSELGKLIGFIGALVLDVTFIILTAYFVSRIFEISGVIKFANHKEETAFACAVIGAVLLVFGSIVYFILEKSKNTKLNQAKIILSIIFSVCGGVATLLCLFFKNYLAILYIIVALAICAVSTILIIRKREKLV